MAAHEYNPIAHWSGDHMADPSNKAQKHRERSGSFSFWSWSMALASTHSHQKFPVCFMDLNLKTVFLHLLLMLSCLKCTEGRNSELTATVTRDSISLKCRYTGNRSVSAVSWYNGSSQVPLTIKANNCVAYSLEKSDFDTARIINSYTCDTSSDLYTLKISPALSLDDRVNISCTFLDPDPGEPKDNVTIHLKENPSDGGSSQVLVTIIAVVVIVAVIVITVVIVIKYWKCKRSTGEKNISFGHNSEQRGNTDLENIPLKETEAQDKEYKDIRQGNKNNGEGV